MDGKLLEVHNMPFSPLRSEPRAAAGSKENLASSRRLGQVEGAARAGRRSSGQKTCSLKSHVSANIPP